MADKQVLRWTVPVDDEWHPIGPGSVVLTGVRHRPDVVEVWTEEPGYPNAARFAVRARVFGTGHPVPESAQHVGSAFAAGGALVWHVYVDGGQP